MQLLIKKVKPEAKIPARAHSNDAGMDLYACGTYTIAPSETMTIPTGIAFQIEDGYVGLIWDKSGIGAKGIKTLGGVVDAGYRGEVMVTLHNTSSNLYTFEHGHKLAQMLIQKVEFPEIVEVEALTDSLRGENGFGSTGK